MSFNSKQPFLLFMHIPKTAGTTLRSIVDLQYCPENVLTYYNQTNRSLIDNLGVHVFSQPNYRALIGHFKFGAHATLPESARYITFVRDPIERTISDYYERIHRTPDKYRKSDGKIMDISEMIEKFPYEMKNHQTKYIAGITADREINKNDCAKAIENIENNFILCGLLEEFDTSILMISQILKWPLCVYHSLNQNKGAPSLFTETNHQMILQRANKFDFILYKKMKERFQYSFDKRGEAFKKSVTKYKKILLKNQSFLRNQGINSKHINVKIEDL
jgi:cell fate (sporulation/competence/biofilm development) regulator YmcA (YheA/YmcA/DUF963 family)